MEQFTVSCDWCLIEFKTEWETKKYCSREHKERAREFRKTGKFKANPEHRTATTIYPRVCPSCDEAFIAKRELNTYCSNYCRKKARERRLEAAGIARRQKKPISIKRRIYFRDNGICQLCNEHIDTAVKYPDPLSLSLDHIVPRSLGGTDKADNLRATHLVCNVRRGNETAPPTQAYAKYLADKQL